MKLPGHWLRTTLRAVLLFAVTAAAAQGQARVQRVRFVKIEPHIDPETQFLCFALLDDDRTNPESQITVILSTPPADSEDIQLRVWLVDSAGGQVKVVGMEQDSIMPWEFRVRLDSGFYSVEWENLRPQFPGRAVYKLRASLSTSPKPKHTAPFVLQHKACKK